MRPLDGIRAFAVLAVVLFHTVGRWFPGGNVGVDIFFVLSGFLITRVLLAELDRTGRISLRDFYLRRSLRLLPALFALIILLTVAYCLLLRGQDRQEGLFSVLAAVTYTSSLLEATGHNLGSLNHMWSLSVEEYFYLAWPVLLAVVSVKTRPHRLLIVALIAVAAVGYRLIVALVGWPLERIYYAADTRSEELVIGCLLALLLAHYSLPVRDVHALGAGGLLVAFVVLPGSLTAPFYRYGGSATLAIAAAVIIAVVAQRPDGPASRLLGAGPLVWTGQRSYGIYLWNLPLAALTGFFLPHGALRTPVVLLLSIVVPALSYRTLEKPFLALKSRLVLARPQLPAPAQGSDLSAARPLHQIKLRQFVSLPVSLFRRQL